MPIYIEIDGRAVEVAVNATQQLLDNMHRIYPEIGRTLRDYVRQTITTQGRSKPWAPLAASTRMVTGRQKAFITLRERIRYRSNSQEVVVFLDDPQENWSIRLHARGYTIPARTAVSRKVMRIPARGKPIFARKAKASVVPPRSIFPTSEEAAKAIAPAIDKFIRDELGGIWR